MIIKSYELKKNTQIFLKYNFYLLYGENIGLKNDIADIIKIATKQKKDKIEILSLYESEILNSEENFYNFVYSGSLFGNKKIITIFEATDKIIKKISNVFDKSPENVLVIIFSGILEKKSRLRNFFEVNKKTICIPCYSDNEKDLERIAQSELKKNSIMLSRETINLLIEKSNSDRNNLRNEIGKIHSYSLNKKKLELTDIISLINFSGDYKSDIFINECLCGNILQYKKILSEFYLETLNQISLLRMLSNKIRRLLNMKEMVDDYNDLDSLLNASKPPIFWKEKPMVKKQLTIWTTSNLKETVQEINDIELLCKKNPQISNMIFFNFFTKICTKANNYS